MSNAVTEGIRVLVESEYLPEESSPANRQYSFSYTVTILNEGGVTVQLRSRHWIIADEDGHVEEVKGSGVVGSQPVLRPGQAFRYTSGCRLRTPFGSMHGTYQMHREDGSVFDADVLPFLLVAPKATRFPN